MKKMTLKEELAKLRNHELKEQTLLVWMQVGLTSMALGIAFSGAVASFGDRTLVVKIVEIFSQLLILIGTTGILAALVQHKLKQRYLRKKYKYKPPFSLASMFAIMIVILGVSSFVANLLYMIYYVF